MGWLGSLLVGRRQKRCTGLVRYTPGRDRYGRECCGEFIFPASSVERSFRATDAAHPDVSWAYGAEATMLAWISQRDDSDRTPTDVPEEWWHFEYTAAELLDAGEGAARCRWCGSDIPLASVHAKPSCGRGPLCHDRYECPSGHPLLIVGRGIMS
jgi:hypothetical protein